MERAVVYIKDILSENGGRIEVQTFEVGKTLYKNVIASYGPKEGPRIVVGAHYDVCYAQPGADDNASGVAGLLELSRMLNEGSPPDLRIDLVAYALEEPPFFGTDEMGSAFHARSLREQGVEVKGMLSLEMIGYFSDEEDSQRYPSILLRPFYPDTGDFIAIVSDFGSRKLKKLVRKNMLTVEGLDVRTLTAPSFFMGVDLSDHRNYWKQDYPAVMVTDTSFFRNPNYHEPTDTADTLDYRMMALVVEGVYRAITDLATEKEKIKPRK